MISPKKQICLTINLRRNANMFAYMITNQVFSWMFEKERQSKKLFASHCLSKKLINTNIMKSYENFTLHEHYI